MNVLITGIAGFVGSQLAAFLKGNLPEVNITGIDNLSRRGSEYNLPALKKLGCRFIHGDIRVKADIEDLPAVDWIIDCAANPSVLAGFNGGTTQLIGHNLIGTLNLLEKCRQHKAGLILLSTSRVYSIEKLNQIPLRADENRLMVDTHQKFPAGFTPAGITEDFSTAAPVSLYGATKLASEIMALEYAYTFDIPLWINRCGVIAGPGQFGKIDQGIFSFWIYQWLLNKPLSYIGFGGKGLQVRDLFGPADLGRLLMKQMKVEDKKIPKVINVGGGLASSFSLKELNAYCEQKFGFPKSINEDAGSRPFDIPYYVTDNTLVQKYWDWQPSTDKYSILDQIFDWAKRNEELIRSEF